MPRGAGRNMAGEKAKDFKGTIKKLIKYMSAFKVHMLFVAVFAICGTVFNIVGPKISRKSDHRDLQRSGEQGFRRRGMDFARIGQILLITLGLYVISALCDVYPGDYHDRSFPEDDITD